MWSFTFLLVWGSLSVGGMMLNTLPLTSEMNMDLARLRSFFFAEVVS